MGLFDFVKGIGKKNTAAAEPQAAPANTTPAAAAQPAEPSAQEVANKLLGHVKGLGLPITGLSISYNSTSDLATVRGCEVRPIVKKLFWRWGILIMWPKWMISLRSAALNRKANSIR